QAFLTHRLAAILTEAVVAFLDAYESLVNLKHRIPIAVGQRVQELARVGRDGLVRNVLSRLFGRLLFGIARLGELVGQSAFLLLQESAEPFHLLFGHLGDPSGRRRHSQNLLLAQNVWQIVAAAPVRTRDDNRLIPGLPTLFCGSDRAIPPIPNGRLERSFRRFESHSTWNFFAFPLSLPE